MSYVEVGLDGTDFLSLLKSLFSDLIRGVIGDFGWTEEGDEEDKLSVIWQGISTTNSALGPLGWGCEEGPSSEHRAPELTCVSFPQNKTFVG